MPKPTVKSFLVSTELTIENDLFKHETDASLEGFEKGTLTSLDAITVDTGKFTGRSPNDKFIVKENSAKDHVWWGPVNSPMKEEVFDILLEKTQFDRLVCNLIL